MNCSQLTEEERNHVNAYLAERRRQLRLADHVTDLDYLLSRWETFVSDVETRDGRYVIEECLNETTVLQIIEDLLNEAPRSL